MLLPEFGRTKGFLRRFSAAVVGASVVAFHIGGQPATASSQAFLPQRMHIKAPDGAEGLCRKYSWACSQTRQSGQLTKGDLKKVSVINKQINRKTRAIDDQSQYRTTEYWTLPSARGGDCEDFALLKKRDLIQAGIAPNRLLIATVLDRRRGGHAVLVFRTDTGDVVLDNLTNRILPWTKTKYTFLRMQDPKSPNRWVGVFEGG